MRHWILFHIEIVLSGAGFVLILTLPHIMDESHEHFWRLGALLLLLISLVVGLAVSAARRSKRMVRRDTINELQAMLKDVATNQLTLIQVNTMLARPMSEKHVQNVMAAIEHLQKALSALSEESLKEWQHKYEHIPQSKVQPMMPPRIKSHNRTQMLQ